MNACKIFLWLIVALGSCAFADTNSPGSPLSVNTASNRLEQLVIRLESAVEKAEAAAKRVEAVAERAEAVRNFAENAPQKTNSIGGAEAAPDNPARTGVPADESLRRVRFMVGTLYNDFNDIDRKARAWLAKEGIPPPKDLPAEFEVADEHVLIVVKYLQRMGEHFWYVKYTRDLEVEEFGSRIRKETD